MKKLFLIVILSIPILLNAQDFILKNTGDTLFCNIKRIDESKIWYTPEKGNVSDFIKINSVKTYRKDGLLLSQKDMAKIFEPSWVKGNTAGKEFVRFTKGYYTGISMSIIGVGLSAIGIATKQNVIIYSGAAIGFTGNIYSIASHRHIKRAGILLDKN